MWSHIGDELVGNVASNHVNNPDLGSRDLPHFQGLQHRNVARSIALSAQSSTRTMFGLVQFRGIMKERKVDKKEE